MFIKNNIQRFHKLTLIFLSIFIFQLFNIISILSDDKSSKKNKSFTLICKEGPLKVQLVGSKIKFKKLKIFITSEIKTFQNLYYPKARRQIKRILKNTNLFTTVKITNSSSGNVTFVLKDTYTLLPIVNFSTNLQSFSYQVGLNESNLLNNAWRIGGAYAKSNVSENYFINSAIIQPNKYIQSISLGGNKGDSFFYYSDSWFKFEKEEVYGNINFKTVFENYRLFYGLQLRYSDLNFNKDPTFSSSFNFSIGRLYQDHDISHGYRFFTNARYLDDKFNKYTFSANIKKNWFKGFIFNPLFRGILLTGQLSYSAVEEELSAVGTIFSFRSSSLHGLRSNSIFSKNFYYAKSRVGLASRKFLWSYWQPHIFLEAGRSDTDNYYSLGGGLLITFTPLFNSRLRIQYYIGELPDKNHGLIIATNIDF